MSLTINGETTMNMNKKGEDSGAGGVGTSGLMVIGGLVILAVLIIILIVNNSDLVRQTLQTISSFLG